MAPGHNLASDTNLSSYLYQLLKTSHVSSKNGQQMLSLSGSSMATAVTSGVVALILQQHNQSGYHRQAALTPNLVKAMLQYSAIRLAGAESPLRMVLHVGNHSGWLCVRRAHV